jgi:hypothetical protein
LPPPGDYVYRSGSSVAGTNGGTFADGQLTQFNLDGSPAAKPVQQPHATLLTGV